MNRATAADMPILTNLLELYLHDLGEWFELELHEDGRYIYPLELSGTREAYLVRVHGLLAGFALIHSAAPWQEADAMDVSEFFIVRRYRGSGLGAYLANWLWDLHPGRWLVRVFEGNLPAVPFWRSAVDARTSGQFDEQRHLIESRNWRYFRLDSTVTGANQRD